MAIDTAQKRHSVIGFAKHWMGAAYPASGDALARAANLHLYAMGGGAGGSGGGLGGKLIALWRRRGRR